MITYKDEQGLDLSNDSISYAVSLIPENRIKQIDKAQAGYFDSIKNNQEDIYWYESILASVGKNLNDDVFTKEDLWNARLTPVNKSVNYMHDNDDRIGHMVASVAISRDGDVISDDTDFESVPADFDIVTASVLYKVWDDPDKLSRAQSIISEIEQGIWKVSMECRFSNFDYGLTSSTGENILIKRDASTAFLTQFLRIYGGVGEWKGYKVGRVLRNFYFSAKGLVKNPANERSLILDSFASANVKKIQDIKDKRMTEETKVIDLNKEVLSELKEAHASQLSSLTDKLEKVEAENKEKIEALKDSLTVAKMDAEKVKEDKEEDKKEAEAKIKSLEESNKEAEAKVTELNEKVEALEKQVAELENEKVVAGRLAKLAKANVEETKAKELMEVWADATEEQFDSVVAAYTVKEDSAEASDLNFEEQEAEGGKFSVPSSNENSESLDNILKSLASNFKKDN